jgi:hypothetical protein
MPTVVGELRTSTEDAADCPELDGFSCGNGRIEAEETVEDIVGDYASGLNSFVTLRVTREYPKGNLVGIVGIEEGGVGYDHPLFQMEDWKDPVYLAVLTLGADYRGRFATQNGTPLSHVLMRDALEFLAFRNGGIVPSVQAAIARENAPSRALAQTFGFEMIPTLGDLLYVRPKGRALPHNEADQ